MNAAPRIEALGAADTGRCACCGRISRKIWGIFRSEPRVRGSYFVHWTVGHVFENGAHFDVIFASHDEDATPPDFHAVSLEYRILDSGPWLRVVDAQERAFVMSPRVGHFLKRSDVIGGPLAGTVFEICDWILLHDRRLAALWDTPEAT